MLDYRSALISQEYRAYIDYANEQAKKENLNAKFICQDIRTITFDQEFKKNGNTKFVRYLVNEKEAEAFDREFPYMEKEKLPGQIF